VPFKGNPAPASRATAGASTPPPATGRQPQKPTIARPYETDIAEAELVAEALPIESQTPLAETVAPSRWSGDSRVIRGTSSMIRGRKPPVRDKKLIAGVGLVLLLVVVIAVIVFTSNNRRTGGPLGSAPGTGEGSDKSALTVGPRGRFQTINDALNYVRENFVPENPSSTQTIRVSAGEPYKESIVLSNSTSSKWPTGIRLVCEDPPAVLIPNGNGPAISLDGVPQITIEGFEIQAKGNTKAIELRGNLTGTKLSRIKIKDFSQTGIDAETVKRLRSDVNAEIDAAIRQAAADPAPDPAGLYDNVYGDPDWHEQFSRMERGGPFGEREGTRG